MERFGCTFCFMEITNDNPVAHMECGNFFHKNCLEEMVDLDAACRGCFPTYTNRSYSGDLIFSNRDEPKQPIVHNTRSASLASLADMANRLKAGAKQQEEKSSKWKKRLEESSEDDSNPENPKEAPNPPQDLL